MLNALGTQPTINNQNLMKASLLDYIQAWEEDYQTQALSIDIFKPALTALWNNQQKQLFIRLFYHFRGHFAEFLWYLGSFAPNEAAKELILSNIRDEFGKSGFSHEQLYLFFAQSFNVDLTYELIEQKWYFPFIQDYINGQMMWLRTSTWEEQISGFTAIEKLDNVDYANFKQLAISIGATGKALTFYNVHVNANHFETLLTNEFMALWDSNSELIVDTFEMIKNYQINAWKKLSAEIFNLK